MTSRTRLLQAASNVHGLPSRKGSSRQEIQRSLFEFHQCDTGMRMETNVKLINGSKREPERWLHGCLEIRRSLFELHQCDTGMRMETNVVRS
jgi:hypothetical protein